MKGRMHLRSIIISLIFPCLVITSYLHYKASKSLSYLFPTMLNYSNENKKKRILFWTKSNIKNHIEQCGQRVCEISNKSSQPEEYDALIFQTTQIQNPPEKRRSNQIYIAHSMESQARRRDKFFMNGYFYNWSISFSRNSTLRRKTFILLNESSSLTAANITTQLRRYKQNRNKYKSSGSSMILWIVSRCRRPSERHMYVEKLNEHIPVDIYGSCGIPCNDTKKDKSSCLRRLVGTGKYKFYLSFENSICKDYLTEKIYNAFIVGLVPIVLGGLSIEDYSHSENVPPNSYIDVRNFQSPKHLADYLKMLDNNDDIYLSYHAWRSRFNVVRYYNWMCDLCNSLYDKEMTSPKMLSWEEFFNPKYLCDKNLVRRLIAMEQSSKSTHSTKKDTGHKYGH